MPSAASSVAATASTPLAPVSAADTSESAWARRPAAEEEARHEDQQRSDTPDDTVREEHPGNGVRRAGLKDG